jgi:hypothetical protein
VLGQPGRTREHYVSMSLKAAALELGCRESDLQEAAARVPIAVQPPKPEGAQ